ncbi:MAG: TlpA family protein disulfide reductase, partial [Planctomycetaceae bacterium]
LKQTRHILDRKRRSAMYESFTAYRDCQGGFGGNSRELVGGKPAGCRTRRPRMIGRLEMLRTVTPSHRRAWFGGCLALVALMLLGSLAGAAETTEPGGTSFSAIIDAKTEQTVLAVAEYLVAHPDAPDAETAYRWLFQTVRTQGLEAQAVAPAEAYLKKAESGSAAMHLAQHVRSIGQARAGNFKEAFAGFEDHLKTVRVRSPNDTVDFALTLSVQAQLAGDYPAAKEVLDKLASAMFLNPTVRELCDNRLAKLELADKPMPDISVEDLDGKKFDSTELTGKVVLVDFWGTNCLPCLAEFPGLKQLYEDTHARGFEIVGISLDEEKETVVDFQKQAKLPWRLALSGTDHDATRRRYEAAKIPSTYLIDQKGRLICFDIRGRDLKLAVERLLGSEKKPNGEKKP